MSKLNYEKLVGNEDDKNQIRGCFRSWPSFEIFFFTWFSPLIRLGGSIKADDLLHLPPRYTAANIYRGFLKCWSKEKEGPLRLWKSLHRLISFEFWMAGLMMMINSFTVLIAPVLLKWIVEANARSQTNKTLLLAFCIMVNSIVGAVAVQQFIHGVFMAGSKVVSAGCFLTISPAIHSRCFKKQAQV